MNPRKISCRIERHVTVSFYTWCFPLIVLLDNGSLSSALHARASSIRNVKLPGVLQSVSKRSGGGPLHTPSSVGAAAGQAQQQHTAAAGGEEKSGISGETDGRERRRDGSGSAMSSSKNVAWEDGGVEEVSLLLGRVGVYRLSLVR